MKFPFLRSSVWAGVLSQAPLIWEVATQVIEHVQHVRSRRAHADGREVPPEEMTLPELGAEVGRLRAQVRELDDAQLEQAKLVRQVAEQHRALALAMKTLTIRFRIVAVVALVFLVLDAWLVWRLSRG